MKDALLLVDVVNDFRHEDGEALLSSFRARQPRLVDRLDQAKGSLPVVYANDDWGRWDGDAPRMVRDAVTNGLGGELVAQVAPRAGEPVVPKPRYSAFDSTPLAILLEHLGVERILLAGMATEMCHAVRDRRAGARLQGQRARRRVRLRRRAARADRSGVPRRRRRRVRRGNQPRGTAR